MICFAPHMGAKQTLVPKLKPVTKRPEEHQLLALEEDASRICKVLCGWSLIAAGEECCWVAELFQQDTQVLQAI